MRLAFKLNSEHVSLGIADTFDHWRGRLTHLAIGSEDFYHTTVGAFNRRLWGQRKLQGIRAHSAEAVTDTKRQLVALVNAILL